MWIEQLAVKVRYLQLGLQPNMQLPRLLGKQI